MMPRRIRLFWTVGAVLAVLMVAGVAAAVLVPRLLPLGDEGSLYRRYRNMPGIEATYLKDFPVNDTLNVDVVLLVADTDAGWDTLHRDFNLTKVTPIVQQMIDQGRLRVLSRLSPRENPSLPIDRANPDNNIVLSENLAEHAMALFYTRNNAENTAVLEYNYCNPNKKIVL
jgi:F420-0:gamma-glutamyl ligase-like protein